MTRKAAANPAADEQYAPGIIRASTDAVHSAVTAFTARHPEYEKLGIDAIIQAAGTHRSDEEHAERERVYGEGVPRNWRRNADNDEVEDLYDAYDSLGRV